MEKKRRFLAILLMLCIMVGLYPIHTQAASVKLSATKMTLTVGCKKTLKVKNLPRKAAVTYSSNRKSVAKVSKKGVVTAVKKGSATITAKVVYKTGKKQKKLTCKVTVKNSVYPVVTADGMKEPSYVKVGDASLTKHTISTKVLEKARKMPVVSANNLPSWHGSTLPLDTLSWDPEDKRNYFIEQDFKEQADMGFDYLRMTLDWKDYCVEKGNTLLIDKNVWDTIDDAIAWCVKYGIHLNLDLHTLPGYNWDETYDVLENKTHYDMTLALWKMVATRYADVPSNVLSYNLVNEPNRQYFTTDECYAGWANDMIAVIRKADRENKLIVSDGMLTNDTWEGACPSMPIEGLPDDVVQTIHLYPYHSLNRCADIQFLNWPYEHLPVVSGRVQEENTLTVCASLEKKSDLILWFSDAWGIREGLIFSWETTAGETGTFDFSEVKEDASKCYRFETQNEKTQGVFGDASYDGVKLVIPIEKAAEGITFTTENGSVTLDQLLIRHYTGKEQKYYMPERGNSYGPKIVYGPYTTDYYMFSGYQEEARTLVFGSDGEISCANENTQLDYFDMESLEAYVRYWHDWSEKTGTPIMVNEFEIMGSMPSEVRTAVLDALLTEFDRYEIPWALYTANYDWSPKVKENTLGWVPIDPTDGYQHKNGYYYDTAALDIIKKHSR